MKTLRVLDTFCCSGGMGYGFHQAGFEVVGVDINPQPNYPFEFHQVDAVEYIDQHGSEFDLIHGSPPCQDYSNLNAYNRKEYPRLIEPVREAMIKSGVPYLLENVESAASHLVNPITLCGTMFGLGVYRHRVFEVSFDLDAPDHPQHVERCARNGYLPTADKTFMTITGGAHSRAWQNAACEAMGMPWISVLPGGNIKRGIREVCEAIPPAYAEWIGRAFISGR